MPHPDLPSLLSSYLWYRVSTSILVPLTITSYIFYLLFDNTSNEGNLCVVAHRTSSRVTNNDRSERMENHFGVPLGRISHNETFHALFEPRILSLLGIFATHPVHHERQLERQNPVDENRSKFDQKWKTKLAKTSETNSYRSTVEISSKMANWEQTSGFQWQNVQNEKQGS